MRELEHINSGEGDYLLKDWIEIFVSCSDFLVFLEATLLENGEESVRFVDGLAAAVNQSPDLEPVHVNLLCCLILLHVLEGRRGQCLA